jgi:ADP-dependent NAD(P)H-hydrate dehydratase / NAD(P)H-hydrate epimerase
MALQILTPAEMATADRLAAERGPFDGPALMANAGAAVAAEVLKRYPDATAVHVLCGPGNNGGDGYVVARLLAAAGINVAVWALARPKRGTDAHSAARQCPIEPRSLKEFAPEPGSLVVDDIFGAGLARPLTGAASQAVAKCAGLRVVAVDLPSGVSGLTGQTLGAAFSAALTVTFVRPKPGHLLEPGRAHCGELVVADIGITDGIVADIEARCFANDPALWRQALPRLAGDTHKYRRGHVAVFSGNLSATGAARLSALAAARAGAGAVTMLSPADALAVNAAHLTSIILREAGSLDEVAAFFGERKPAALVFGPGLATKPKVARFAVDMLAGISYAPCTIVFDASALTAFARDPAPLFTAAHRERAPKIVLTPHDGEFSRLFPDLRAEPSKLERARAAARRANSVVIYKGPDTVIAAPDGRAAINANGTPLLATAGSGDVLSGLVAGLAAQGMLPFDAACAAVWAHAEAARAFGFGVIAEDLPLAVATVLGKLHFGILGQSGNA